MGIDIPQHDWQHWNGGAFVFDREAADFMDFWHEATFKIFQLDRWAIRDQGTLIAAAWKFGLQHQPTLPMEFNFIADYYTDHLEFDPEQGFTFDQGRHYIRPYFVHIYHGFGRQDWPVWQWVESTLH